MPEDRVEDQAHEPVTQGVVGLKPVLNDPRQGRVNGVYAFQLHDLKAFVSDEFPQPVLCVALEVGRIEVLWLQERNA